MRMRTTAALVMALLMCQVTISGCRKSESERVKAAPEAHEKQMIKKSFEESKKAAAARVNGETITEFALLREMNLVTSGYVNAGQQPSPDLRAKIRNDSLNTLITQELAVQEARKRGIKMKQEDVDAEIKRIREQTGSPAAFQDYLNANGFTEAELRRMVEKDILFEKIATQEIDEKVIVAEAAVKERYKREKKGPKDAAHGKMTFQDAKPVLEQKIREEEAEKRMQAWEKELKKNASIEIINH